MTRRLHGLTVNQYSSRHDASSPFTVLLRLAYFSQGLAGTLIQHPLAYHLKANGMAAAHHVAQALAFIAIPWIVKPLYGLISDSIPLCGYRRKSYLLLATSLSTVGYFAITQIGTPDFILWVLVVTTLGMAAMDVLVDALMVEDDGRQRIGHVAKPRQDIPRQKPSSRTGCRRRANRRSCSWPSTNPPGAKSGWRRKYGSTPSRSHPPGSAVSGCGMIWRPCASG